MAKKTKLFALIGTVVLVGGCSVVEEGLWPILSEDPEPTIRAAARVATPAPLPPRTPAAPAR